MYVNKERYIQLMTTNFSSFQHRWLCNFKLHQRKQAQLKRHRIYWKSKNFRCLDCSYQINEKRMPECVIDIETQRSVELLSFPLFFSSLLFPSILLFPRRQPFVILISHLFFIHYFLVLLEQSSCGLLSFLFCTEEDVS